MFVRRGLLGPHVIIILDFEIKVRILTLKSEFVSELSEFQLYSQSTDFKVRTLNKFTCGPNPLLYVRDNISNKEHELNISYGMVPWRYAIVKYMP